MIASNISNADILSMKDMEEYPNGKEQPMPHGEVYQTLIKAAKEYEWELIDSHCGITKDKLNAVLAIEFNNHLLPKLPKGVAYSFAVINANDGHNAMHFFGGVAVYNKLGVCFHELDIRQRHLWRTYLKDVLLNGMDLYQMFASDYASEVQFLKDHIIKERVYHKLLIEAGRKKLMPWSRLGRVDKIYTSRSKPTAWNLMLSFSKIVRMNPPLHQCEQLLGFKSLIYSSLMVKQS